MNVPLTWKELIAKPNMTREEMEVVTNVMIVRRKRFPEKTPEEVFNLVMAQVEKEL